MRYPCTPRRPRLTPPHPARLPPHQHSCKLLTLLGTGTGLHRLLSAIPGPPPHRAQPGLSPSRKMGPGAQLAEGGSLGSVRVRNWSLVPSSGTTPGSSRETPGPAGTVPTAQGVTGVRKTLQLSRVEAGQLWPPGPGWIKGECREETRACPVEGGSIVAPEPQHQRARSPLVCPCPGSCVASSTGSSQGPWELPFSPRS